MDLLGIDLTPDPRFDDGRELTIEQAADIDRSLSRASLVPRLDLAGDPAHVLAIARAVHARLVQPAHRMVPRAAICAALDEAGIGIVYGGYEVAHDDDPGWVFSDLPTDQNLGASLFQLDVLPEYPDSWAFLRDRSPEYEDEFQIADLDGIAAERPLLAGLNYTPDNVREIVQALPHIRGAVMTLASSTRRAGVRSHSLDDVLGVLRAVTG